MIKTVIIGGSTPVAGELIRILINHPDVDILQVQSDENVGRDVSEVHTGLIGETDLKISSTADVSKSNMVFVCDFSALPAVDDEQRVVCFFPPLAEKDKYVYGLPELNRKAMVRGATRAVIPSAQAMLAALAILPLAKNLMLKGNVDIKIGLPSAITEYDVKEELLRELSRIQNSLDIRLDIVSGRIQAERVMTVDCSLDLDIDLGEIEKIYDEFYSDHRFTFRVNRAPMMADVEGTNKCLIYLSRGEDGRLTIKAAFDAVVKGNAGTAVHCMNLLFGLHELTGLTLKASRLGWDVID